ncbi:hypothetical protein MUK42_35613 [Musa troglodytarum]|uniref:Uncharacterized protein n=1 Tax=Musa troglodytarum TaxID=320322 RepID=A0A9E7K2B4_9LILI|nr:hypothetical protein MUK42_35613 [Musa troglodytarum]
MTTPVTVPQFSLPSEHRLRLSFAGRERWSDIFSTLVYVFVDFLWRTQLKSAPRRCGFGLGLGFLVADRRLFSAFPWRWRLMISSTAPVPRPLQVPRHPVTSSGFASQLNEPVRLSHPTNQGRLLPSATHAIASHVETKFPSQFSNYHVLGRTRSPVLPSHEAANLLNHYPTADYRR